MMICLYIDYSHTDKVISTFRIYSADCRARRNKSESLEGIIRRISEVYSGRRSTVYSQEWLFDTLESGRCHSAVKRVSRNWWKVERVRAWKVEKVVLANIIINHQLTRSW